MRVKLTLMAKGAKATLPLNYNHAVAALIYRTLGKASEEFAAMLHDEGFKAGRRSFKLFTFSRLFASRKGRVSRGLDLIQKARGVAGEASTSARTRSCF